MNSLSRSSLVFSSFSFGIIQVWLIFFLFLKISFFTLFRLCVINYWFFVLLCFIIFTCFIFTYFTINNYFFSLFFWFSFTSDCKDATVTTLLSWKIISWTLYWFRIWIGLYTLLRKFLPKNSFFPQTQTFWLTFN